ncbi:MAG TPA: hypothetical protein VGO45_04560 [Bacteroidia bacterium]|jgi:hypothetical protein|nr:hypothetical protein [Bacteroidia bacterium]
MKRIILLSLSLLLSITSFQSCHGKKLSSNASSAAPKDYSGMGYAAATMLKYDVDGCKWLVQLENGQKLVPSKLPGPDFLKDGLKVWVRYTLQKGGMGICMAGEAIELTGIEKRM